MAESSTGRPVLTVSRDLSFDMRNRQGTKGERHADTDTGTSKDDGYGIYLNEDWDSGIGGGLWTTGLALAKYFIASPHFLQQFRLLQLKRRWNAGDNNNRSLRVLELGSGNGFLSVCLVTAIAAAAANEDEEPDSNSDCWPGIEVVVTDTAEHLNLMKTTIESNLKRIFPKILRDQQTRRKNAARNETTKDGDDDDDDDDKNDVEQNKTFSSSTRSPQATFDVDIKKIASVKEYVWGESYDFGSDPSSFDLIVGSDVAYRDYLHDPLIAALKEFSRPPPHPTVVLIGVTMNDTKPIFFEKLKKEGFCYEKLADHLFDKEFSTCSRQFGIFAISRM
mmetsp:Transcript_12654/g.26674  ORF Transcript_12654/g.26674 Transcript_12654/m.26674 type:complete len:335 (+) Transcript_12654:160-1164(+)